MKKYQLMAPGPTPVPSEVLLAMARPIILGPEAAQHPGRFSVACDDDLFVFGFAEKPGEILDFGWRNPPSRRTSELPEPMP